MKPVRKYRKHQRRFTGPCACKLSDEDALAILQYARAAREVKRFGRYPWQFFIRLAKLYGVSKDTIKRIVHRKTYRHIKLRARRWG